MAQCRVSKPIHYICATDIDILLCHHIGCLVHSVCSAHWVEVNSILTSHPQLTLQTAVEDSNERRLIENDWPLPLHFKTLNKIGVDIAHRVLFASLSLEELLACKAAPL
jgi:hypothetical protein